MKLFKKGLQIPRPSDFQSFPRNVRSFPVIAAPFQNQWVKEVMAVLLDESRTMIHAALFPAY